MAARIPLAAILFAMLGMPCAGQISTGELTALEQRFARGGPDAASIAEQLLQRPATQLDQLLVLGQIAGTNSQLLLAARAFQRACEIQPKSFPAQFNLGVTLYRESLSAEAVQPLTQAAALNGSSFDAQYLLGVVLSQTGRKTDAIRSLRRAHSLNGKHPGAMSLLAVLYLEQDFSLDAADILNEAVAQTPNDRNLLLLLADAHHRNFQLDRALASAQHAAELFPDSAETQFRLGYELETNGHFEDAEAAYKKSLTLQPNRSETALALGRLALRTGQTADAINYLEPIANKSGAYEIQLELTRAWIAAGQAAKAQALLEQLAIARPNDPAPHLLLAQIYQSARQADLSEKERARYLELSRRALTEGSGMGGITSALRKRFQP